MSEQAVATHNSPEATDISEVHVCRECKSALSAAWDTVSDEIHVRHSYDQVVSGGCDACHLCGWLWKNLMAPLRNKQQPAVPVAEDFSFTLSSAGGPGSTKRITILINHAEAASWNTTLYLRDPTLPRGWRRPQDETRRYLDEWESMKWDTLLRFPDPSRISTRVGSDRSVHIAQEWLSRCDADHLHCKSHHPHATSQHFFPTRIIDTAQSHAGLVHIRRRDECCHSQSLNKVHNEGEEEEEEVSKYWTLSHRWGDPSRLPKLLQANVGVFMKDGVRLDTLPQTFQDAISLVRRLGHRYLWIDCLCILQDSMDDWTTQSAAMEDIYSHSYCNISALASSSDSEDGLFGRRVFDGVFLYPRHVALDGFVGLLWDGSEWDVDVEKAALSKRAWVVQERFLAPRVLHFAKTQLYWECMEARHKEISAESYQEHGHVRPGGVDTTRWEELTRSLSAYKAARRNLMEGQEGHAPQVSLPMLKPDEVVNAAPWRKIVSIYGSCDLTEESDRLVAMHGIAKAFRQSKGETDEYLAGLWKNSLQSNLLWHAGGPNEQRKLSTRHSRHSTCVPTWSWASVAGGRVYIPTYSLLSLRLPPESLIEFVDARIEPEAGGDTYGRLRRAELVIRAKAYPYSSLGDGGGIVLYEDAEMTQVRATVPMSHDLKLDTKELVKRSATESGIQGLCIPVSTQEGDDRGCRWARRTTHLLLERTADGQYERLGIMNLERRSGERAAEDYFSIMSQPWTELTLV